MKPNKLSPQIPENYLCQFTIKLDEMTTYIIDFDRYSKTRFPHEKIDLLLKTSKTTK
jgi:hypothetical protein